MRDDKETEKKGGGDVKRYMNANKKIKILIEKPLSKKNLRGTKNNEGRKKE